MRKRETRAEHGGLKLMNLKYLKRERREGTVREGAVLGGVRYSAADTKARCTRAALGCRLKKGQE